MLTATLHGIDGTYLGGIPSLVGATVLEELDDLGGGSVTVHIDNTMASSLTYRRFVKIWDRGQAIGAFIVAKREESIVDNGGESARLLTVSGPGLLAWLKDAIVYQAEQTAASRSVRSFSWGGADGAWRDTSQWGVPTSTFRQDDMSPANTRAARPTNWPTEAAASWWIWDRPGSAPAGTCYFRREFTVVTAGEYVTVFAADDMCEILLDGEPVVGQWDALGWQQTWTFTANLAAGSHTLGVKVYNAGGTAGLLLWMGLRNADDSLTELLRTGDSGWTIAPYPTREPGWTAGNVLATLVDEGATRGVTGLGLLTPDFTATLDSSSAAWATWPISARVGDTVWDVAQDLRLLGCDMRVDPSDLTLQAWVDRRTTTTAVISAQAHAESLSEVVEQPMANTLLVDSDEQWGGARHWASLIAYGRVEAFLDASGLDAAVASKVARATLEQYAEAPESVTVQYVPGQGNVPWVDVNVGDLLWVSTSGGAHVRRRVWSLSASMGDQGQTVYAVELDALSRDRISLLQRLIDRASVRRAAGASARGGSGNGSGGDSPGGEGVPPEGNPVPDPKDEWPTDPPEDYPGPPETWPTDPPDGWPENWPDTKPSWYPGNPEDYPSTPPSWWPGLERWNDWNDPSSYEWPGGGDAAFDGTPGQLPSLPTLFPPQVSTPGTTPEEVWSMGVVDSAVALNPSDYWGVEDLEVALCSSEPTNSSGGWPSLATFELTGGTATGYARATLAATAVGAASYSAGSENRLSTAAVTFAPNSGAAAWPTVTHIALCADSDGKVLAVISLAAPLVVGPNEAVTIPAGQIIFAHACAGA